MAVPVRSDSRDQVVAQARWKDVVGVVEKMRLGAPHGGLGTGDVTAVVRFWDVDRNHSNGHRDIRDFPVGEEGDL